MTDLGTLGGTRSAAGDTNDEGVIVGESTASPGQSAASHAVVWRDGVMTDLGSPMDSATAINGVGRVVGMTSAPPAPGLGRAFFWRDGVMTDLGTLGGTINTGPADVNDRGEVVGSAFTATNSLHAFLWRDGVMTDLGTLGGDRSGASGINDKGQVVGSGTLPGSVKGSPQHAFLWQNGVMTDLGTLGGASSYAAAINNVGQVVGTSTTRSGVTDAFLWQNGLMIDLGRLEGTSPSDECGATDINDRGQIIGSCRQRGFLHEAVP